ncbi:MAG: 30S ribosomal protein S21 [Mycoplasmataceae bacterium]|jgi:small subunit ribosomal protein S21|nr:30S ribosomal protein S21 [Mycoplasmataceae bacterium]
MAKVIIKGDFNEAVRRFSHITMETKKAAKKHEYYLRPGLRKIEKSKEALKTNARARKRIAKRTATI